MYHVRCMCSIKRSRDLLSERKGLAFREGPVPNLLGEREARDQFHYEKVQVLIGAQVVDCRDVWMVQSGQNESFSTESFTCGDVDRPGQRQQLQGDHAVKAKVMGTKHHAHTTLSNALDDSIMG